MLDCLVFLAKFVKPLKPYNEQDVNRVLRSLAKKVELERK